MNDHRLGVDFNPPDADQRQTILLEQEGVPGIAVLGRSQFRYQGHSAIDHTHEGCLEIVLCQRGALTFVKGSHSYDLMPGELIINYPGEKHRLATHPKGLALYWILVRIEPLGTPLLKLPPKERRTLQQALANLKPQIRHDDGTLRLAFARLFTAALRTPDNLRLVEMIGAALHLLLATLHTSPTIRETPVATRINNIIKMLRANPNENFYVDQLAQQAALSPSRFNTLFKRQTGLPPHLFQLELRLEKAKQMLRDTNTPITKIAIDLGFNSSQHFAGAFKRFTGQTPSSWRITPPPTH